MVDCSKYPNLPPEVIYEATIQLMEYGEEDFSYPFWDNLKVLGVYYRLHFLNDYVYGDKEI